MTLTGAEAANSVTLGASGNLAQPTLQITDPAGAEHAHERDRLHQPRHPRPRQLGRLRDTLAITSGALTNAADGSISVTRRRRPRHHQRPGRQHRQRDSGQVVNDGGVTIAAGATCHGGQRPDVRPGRWHPDRRRLFPVTGATFIYHGGTIPNPFVLSGATLDLAAPAASPDTFILEGSANILAGDVPAGHTLQITDPTGAEHAHQRDRLHQPRHPRPRQFGRLRDDPRRSPRGRSPTPPTAASASPARRPGRHQRPGRQPRRRHDRGRGGPDGERPGQQRRQLHDRERRHLGDDRGHPDVRPGRWHPDRNSRSPSPAPPSSTTAARSRARSSCPAPRSTSRPRPPAPTRSSSRAPRTSWPATCRPATPCRSPTPGPSTLTSATGFTNHGTLVLNSSIGYGTPSRSPRGRSPTPPTAASASTRHGGPGHHQRPGRQPRRRSIAAGATLTSRPGRQRRQRHDRERGHLS